MARREDSGLDRELADLPPDLRWREWMRRIEAVLFASGAPVPRDHLARGVGPSASVDLLIEGLTADLGGRPHEVGPVSYTHLPAPETALDIGCRLLLEKKKNIHAKGSHQPEEQDAHTL